MSVHANHTGAAAPPRTNIAARLGAMLLVVLGVLFLITSLLGFIPEDRRMTVMGLILFAVLGLVLGGAGLTWLRRQSSSEESERNAWQERAVLELMARSGGEASLGEVSRQLSLPPADTEAIFGRLTAQRMVAPELTGDGSVVYRVRE
jgi:hypothetical protein